MAAVQFERQWSDAAGWRWCGDGVRWHRAVEHPLSEVAASGPRPWATWVLDGLGRTLNGLGRARALPPSAVLPGGGGDD
jgi:hypothetical protein